jgi:hypothetical protein
MISGAHLIIHSLDAEADHAFIRNVLHYPHVDTGGGWPVFKLPPAEIAVHPAESQGSHELFLMCDGIEATMVEPSAAGVVFSRPLSEERRGRLTALKLPGGGELGLYEPRRPTALDL